MNVNDYIEVRLTKEGLKVYKTYYKKLGMRPIPLKKGRGDWARFQLWDFMHIFGEAMRMDLPVIIVKNKVRIPVEKK
jgi:hypothetical protein